MHGEQESPPQETASKKDFSPHSEGCRFGIYEEGDGVFSLYLPEVNAPALLNTLATLAEDKTLCVLSGSRMPSAGIPIGLGGAIFSATALSELEAPSESVIFEGPPNPAEINRCLPSSLMACPQGALPERLSAAFAVIFPDPKHLILLAPDPGLLFAILQHHLSLSGIGIQTDTRIEGALQGEILKKLEPWSWREVQHEVQSGVQRLQIATLGAENEESLEWVAPRKGGYWRSGWSW